MFMGVQCGFSTRLRVTSSVNGHEVADVYQRAPEPVGTWERTTKPLNFAFFLCLELENHWATSEARFRFPAQTTVTLFRGAKLGSACYHSRRGCDREAFHVLHWREGLVPAFKDIFPKPEKCCILKVKLDTFESANKAVDVASGRYMFTAVENISGNIHVGKYFFWFPEVIWEVPL